MESPFLVISSVDTYRGTPSPSGSGTLVGIGVEISTVSLEETSGSYGCGDGKAASPVPHAGSHRASSRTGEAAAMQPDGSSNWVTTADPSASASASADGVHGPCPVTVTHQPDSSGLGAIASVDGPKYGRRRVAAGTASIVQRVP